MNQHEDVVMNDIAELSINKQEAINNERGGNQAGNFIPVPKAAHKQG